MEQHLDKLILKSIRAGYVASDDIDDLCSLSGFSRAQVYDLVATYIASGFASGGLSYEDADAVANFLWAESSFELSGFAKDVFLAFDDGEYVAASDPPDTDPVAKYTRPQVADLLARRPQV